MRDDQLKTFLLDNVENKQSNFITFLYNADFILATICSSKNDFNHEDSSKIASTMLKRIGSYSKKYFKISIDKKICNLENVRQVAQDIDKAYSKCLSLNEKITYSEACTENDIKLISKDVNYGYYSMLAAISRNIDYYYFCGECSNELSGILVYTSESCDNFLY